jgi:ArsR family transcriptional regulator, lead/cadmium/zinc/bismuth-responsive transcriptional repressor
MSTHSYVQGPRRRQAEPTAEESDSCDVFHIDPARVARLREALIGSEAVSALAETFRVLGDPTRVRMLDALSHGELCVCDLATLLGLTESAVSHQLRLLRSLRLVRARRAGRMVYYALDDRHIVTLFKQGLIHVAESDGRPRVQASHRRAAPVAGGARTRG